MQVVFKSDLESFSKSHFNLHLYNWLGHESHEKFCKKMEAFSFQRTMLSSLQYSAHGHYFVFAFFFDNFALSFFRILHLLSSIIISVLLLPYSKTLCLV